MKVPAIIPPFLYLVLHSISVQATSYPTSKTSGSSSASPSRTTAVEAIVQETLDLINDGEKEIVLDEEQKSIVLVAGITGAGKSTITKFIIGEDLESYKKGFRYLIRDNEGKISNKTVVSKTIFPDRFVNNLTGTVYYDLPGFSDTRNASVELACALFMKKVADHANEVKILFIVSYSSILAGENRIDFKTTLLHALTYVKEPSKFASGIGLVVSKVPARIEDDEVITGVVDFMEDAKRSMVEIFQDAETIRKATDLIDIFLTKDGHRYTRIGFFKQPTSPGYLSSMPIFVDRRQNLNALVEDRLQFVSKDEEDFGMSVSSDAKFYVKMLLEKLCTQLQYLASIAASGFDVPSTLPVGVMLNEISVLNPLVMKLDVSMTRQMFIETLEKIALARDVPKESTNKLKSLERNVQFYEEITNSERNWNPVDWIQPFKMVLAELQTRASVMIRKLNEQTESKLQQISGSFKEVCDTIFAFKPSKALAPQVEVQRKAETDVETLKRISMELTTKATYNNFVETFQNGLDSLSIKADFVRIQLLQTDIDFRSQPHLRTDAWRIYVFELVQAFDSKVAHYRHSISEILHRGEIDVKDRDLLKLAAKVNETTQEVHVLGINLQETRNRLNNLTIEMAGKQERINEYRRWESKSDSVIKGLRQEKEVCKVGADEQATRIEGLVTEVGEKQTKLYELEAQLVVSKSRTDRFRTFATKCSSTVNSVKEGRWYDFLPAAGAIARNNEAIDFINNSNLPT